MRIKLLLTLLFFSVFPLVFTSYSQAEVKKSLKYPQFKGKIVRNIIIKLRDVFDNTENSFIYRQANALKINTKEEVIKREVLLKEGKEFNEISLEESERNLRGFKYLRNVNIIPVDAGNFVDLYVNVQDTWTVIPQVGFSTGTGTNKASMGLVESNVLGYGKKIGARYYKEDERSSIETVYDDNRFLGTQTNFNIGYFDRSDGEISFINIGRPFRSYSQHNSWSFSANTGDTIGRLFENADERYIFRQKNTEIAGRFSVQRGDPETAVHRLSIGADYISDDFTQADKEDYDNLNLSPNEVSNDLSQLAEDRKYAGPSLAYHFIEPNFISKNYIDRFDRVDDYNLGTEYSLSSMFAPDFFGSDQDTFLFTANRSGGWQFNEDSFMRGEMGYASRYDQNGAHNSLYRAELKFYNVFGPQHIKELYIGKHTLAFSVFADYADDLDKDREFLVGGDSVIRGYKSRTFPGDKRLGVNLEDRVHFIDDAFQLVSLGAAVFFDGGGATYDSFGNIITEDFYSDVGFGLRIAFPRSTGSQVLRVDIAYPLRDGPDGSGQFEPRILISGGQIFDSHLRSELMGTEKANVDIGFDR